MRLFWCFFIICSVAFISTSCRRVLIQPPIGNWVFEQSSILADERLELSLYSDSRYSLQRYYRDSKTMVEEFVHLALGEYFIDGQTLTLMPADAVSRHRIAGRFQDEVLLISFPLGVKVLKYEGID